MESVKRRNSMIVQLVLSFISIVLASSPLEVSITPSHVHFRHSSEEKVITCSATAPVHKCQIRVFNLNSDSPTLVPIEGNETMGQRHASNTGNETLSCSINLSAKQLVGEDSLYAVVCRARSDTSVWSYALTSAFLSYSKQRIDFQVANRQVVATTHQEVQTYITSAQELYSCTLLLDKMIINAFTLQSYPCGGIQQYCYLQEKRGAWKRNCGVIIRSASTRENGILIFVLQTTGPSYSMEKTFVSITIAKPPNPPMLSYEVSVNADGTSTLTASCIVTGSRPAANLTWYVGTDVVSDVRVWNVVHDGWLWPFDEQTTWQKLTMTLQQEHVNKEVKCEISHFVLQQRFQDKFVITKDFMSATSPSRATPATVSHTHSVPTPSTPNRTPSSMSQNDYDEEIESRLQGIGKKADSWFLIEAVILIILFVLIVILIIGYYRHNYYSFCQLKQQGGVHYRRSFKTPDGDKETPPSKTQSQRMTGEVPSDYIR